MEINNMSEIFVGDIFSDFISGVIVKTNINNTQHSSHKREDTV